jgi:phosphodiesterase/alkaline phosphatase D-like protein
MPLRAQSPTATTNAATSVGDLSATLNGLVNPDGVSNSVFFQYGTTTSYGQAIQAVPSEIAGFADVSESVVLTGLLPNTTYHFRMGTSPAGMASRYGADMTFTTGAPATPPSAGMASTSAIYTTLVQIQCPVSSGSSEAVVSVEYGPTEGYGFTATPQNPTVPINTSSRTTFAQITGLQPGTTYHYRFKAVNNEGTGYSADASFTTLEAPVITTGVVDSITDLAAVINGTLDRKGGQYFIHAQYGITTAYGQLAGLGNTSLLTGPQPFSNAVSTLLPSTTYHYRIAVSDIFSNTYYGTDQTFTTASANTPPEVQANSVTANVQTPTRSELYLTWLKTGSSATTVSYEYGLTTSYGSVAVHPTPRPVNRFEESYVAPVQLTGLTPGMTYHFRGKAVNAQGTVYTDDRTFTTPAGPVLITGAATGITDLAATVGGTVNTNSLLLEMIFEYGTSTSYGSSEWVPLFQQNTSAAAVSVNLTYLQPATTYHYRLKAVNHWQPTEVFYGPDATFTTGSAATQPTVTSVTSSNILTRSAQVLANVYSGSSEASVKFEYGETNALGLTVNLSAQPLNVTLTRATTLTDLTPGTTYFYRCVAINAEGAAISPIQSFTTVATTPPSVGAISTIVVRTTAVAVQVVNAYAGSSPASTTWDYGLTTDYGSTSPGDDVAVDATITATGLLQGLQPGTTYHYRCRITSADGSASSADGTFTTSTGPVPVTAAATSITDLSALLNGSAAAVAGALTCYFEVGTTTAYGQTFTPFPDAISSPSSTPKSAFATGLLPSTLYHYRFCVRDQDNNVFNGNDMTFTTAAAATPPVVTANAPISLSAYGATLKANVSAGSSPATLVFEWGTTTAYGSQITHSTPLGTSQYELITDALSGLTPSTTYHYRLVATNNEGTSNGPNTTFTTPALPIVSTGSASNVQSTLATLQGTFNTGGGTYTAVFDYGETTSYGLTASPSPGGLILIGPGGILIGGGSPTVNPSSTINVQPQKTYHFRLRLTDSYGNPFTGADATFTTPSAVEAWRQQYFGSTANSGNAADDANPAGDGITNLIKYALWMNPTQPGTQPPPVVTEVSGTRYLGMNFPRNPYAYDVMYEVQAADSPLGPWTTVMSITPGNPPSGPGFVDEQVFYMGGGFGLPITVVSDVVYVRDTVPLGSTPHRFMRLQVQRQP